MCKGVERIFYKWLFQELQGKRKKKRRRRRRTTQLAICIAETEKGGKRKKRIKNLAGHLWIRKEKGEEKEEIGRREKEEREGEGRRGSEVVVGSQSHLKEGGLRAQQIFLHI